MVPSATMASQESSLSGSMCPRWVANCPWALIEDSVSGAILKLTISAPQPFRNSRRDGVMLFSLGIFSNGAQHAHVGKAAAQHSSQRGADLLVRGLRVCIQHSLRCQDHAAQAKSAL